MFDMFFEAFGKNFKGVCTSLPVDPNGLFLSSNHLYIDLDFLSLFLTSWSSLGSLGALLGRSRGCLGLSWSSLGAFLGCLGAVLEPRMPQERFGLILSPFWSPFWGPF